MSSVPYSRYIVGSVPWYSFLIVTGIVIAIFLAVRGERKAGLPKDTVIDLALWILPLGIIGARLYYVIFSWDQFKDDLLSVFRIWEGGIAIYGGIIAGMAVLILFCRKRHLPPLLLCDIIAPGLVLAQSLGRWGNWFNIEAYGRAVTRPELCFFPFALQVPQDAYTWHYATFFYESAWNLLIFIFLISVGKKICSRQGDTFFFYVFLYAAGRLVIEELRLDSLFASSSVRISQLLSVLLCISVFLRYFCSFLKLRRPSPLVYFLFLPLFLSASFPALLYSLSGSFLKSWPGARIILFLSLCSLIMIICIFAVHHTLTKAEACNADNKA